MAAQDLADGIATVREEKLSHGGREGVVRQSLAMSTYSIEKSTVAQMQMPALVVHGDEDRLVPFAYGEECAAILPHARFVPLHGAGQLKRGSEATSPKFAG